jgi:signal transduction histidine kinase
MGCEGPFTGVLFVWFSVFLECYDNTYRIFGIPPGTPISYERFAACIDPEDRELVDIAWHNALQGAPYDVSHRIRIGHRTRWVCERAKLELSADGTLRAGIGTVQDITAQVETEEALRQASAAADAANHAKSLFLATMSHEIRTPLNTVIDGFAFGVDHPGILFGGTGADEMNAGVHGISVL